MVAVKFLVFVSEVVSIFSKILTLIIGGGKRIPLPHQLNYWGARAPAAPLSLRLCTDTIAYLLLCLRLRVLYFSVWQLILLLSVCLSVGLSHSLTIFSLSVSHGICFCFFICFLSIYLSLIYSATN